MRRLALFSMTAVLGAGCAHQYGGRATVLAEGRGQLTPSVELDVVDERGNASEKATLVPWAQVGMGYHQGIGHRTELGLRVFGFGFPGVAGEFGVAADSKFQLYQADDREHGWDISVGLSPSWHFGVQGDQPSHVFGFSVPLLFGYNFGPHQVVLGLRFSDFILTSYGARPVNTLWGGASIGTSFRVRRVELFPELLVQYSPIKFGGEHPAEQREGVFYVSFGLSVPINLGGP